MNTATRTPTDTSTHPTARQRASLRALVLEDARRLLRHPAMLSALLLVLASWLLPLALGGGAAPYPDLTSASWTAQYPMLILAAGTFTAANLLSLSPHRYRTNEFEQALSLPQWQRTAVLGVATVVPATIGLVIAAAKLAVMMGQPGAAGSLAVGELLAVPAVIILAGMLGQLAAVLVPNAAVGMVTLVVSAIIGLLGLGAAAHRSRWLAFIAGEDPFQTPPMPSDLIDRPEWWHLMWLLGLAALVAATSVRLTGLRTRPLPVMGLATVAIILAGVMQLRPPSADLQERLHVANRAPAKVQVCETHEKITYCAFPEFRNRIGAWADIVQRQLRAIPPSTRVPVFHVRQHLPVAFGDQNISQPLPLDVWAQDDDAAGTPNAVPVSTRWAAGGTDSFDEQEVIGFSGLVATVIVSGGQVPPDGFLACGARGAVVLWLAASATLDTRAALTTVLAHTSGGGGLHLPVLNSAAGLHLGTREVALARAMLDSDHETVQAKVLQHWQTLTASSTSVDQAASVIGLSAPQAPPLGGVCG